jgi:hypothetical protein
MWWMKPLAMSVTLNLLHTHPLTEIRQLVRTIISVSIAGEVMILSLYE